MRQLLAKATDNLGRSMPARLSIDSNRFTLIDSAGNEKPINSLSMDVVFIDLNDNVSKMYWGKDYNKNDTGDIPVCWSDNGTAPSSQADKPQSPTCLQCPHNVIGSAISKFTGAKIKACVDSKKLAFVIPGGSVPGVPGDSVFLYTMKPGSFNNWKSYINHLKAQKTDGGNAPELYEIVTRLEFESQGVLKFSPVNWSKQWMPEIEAAFNRGTTAEIVGQNDTPWNGQLAAPAPVQQIAAPVQQMATPVQPAPFAQPLPQSSADAPARKPRRTKAQIEADNAAAAKTAQPAGAPSAMFTNPQPAPAPAFAPPAQVQATPPVQGQAADLNDGLNIPAFLQRNPVVAPAAPAAQQFGLATPVAADPGMLAAIEAAFKLPT